MQRGNLNTSKTGIEGTLIREESWNGACPVLAGNPSGNWHGHSTVYPMSVKSSQNSGWQGLLKARKGSPGTPRMSKRDAEHNAATPGLWRLGVRQSTSDLRTKKANESTLAGIRLTPWGKDDGSTTLDQNREHNKANEITDITRVTGTNWPTPAHDAAGNMTQTPRPLSLTNRYDLKWDAWNRLVEVKNTGGSVVATYQYAELAQSRRSVSGGKLAGNGNQRRITKATGGTTRHYYYSNSWQVLEERVDASETADRRFVWGIKGIDDLILRDRIDGGTERLYALSDGMSITAVVNTSGTVQERYGYSGFGVPRYMTASFGNRSSSNFDWETLFHSYRYDLETGLYQVRYRYLHPNLGRFLNRDPIEEQGGLNLYAFVGNDPINHWDRYGNESSNSKKIVVSKIIDDGIELACYTLEIAEITASESNSARRSIFNGFGSFQRTIGQANATGYYPQFDRNMYNTLGQLSREGQSVRIPWSQHVGSALLVYNFVTFAVSYQSQLDIVLDAAVNYVSSPRSATCERMCNEMHTFVTSIPDPSNILAASSYYKHMDCLTRCYDAHGFH